MRKISLFELAPIDRAAFIGLWIGQPKTVTVEVTRMVTAEVTRIVRKTQLSQSRSPESLKSPQVVEVTRIVPMANTATPAQLQQLRLEVI